VGGCKPFLRDVVGGFGCAALMRVCRESIEHEGVGNDLRVTDLTLFGDCSGCVTNNVAVGSSCWS
jgi:hypothetical protein